jgi:hypothetical protein
VILKRIFETWILLNPIKLSTVLSYIVVRSLSYRNFGTGEFPLDCSFEICGFFSKLHTFKFRYKKFHVHTYVHPLPNFFVQLFWRYENIDFWAGPLSGSIEPRFQCVFSCLRSLSYAHAALGH